jgi:hypothetical protein
MPYLEKKSSVEMNDGVLRPQESDMINGRTIPIFPLALMLTHHPKPATPTASSR